MLQRPVSRLNSIDQFFRTYSRSFGITKASRGVCVSVCVRASWQSHRNGVVRAKTQVAISRSGGDAVSVSVKATGGRRGLELPPQVWDFCTRRFQMGNRRYEKWEEWFVAGGGRLLSSRSGLIYANDPQPCWLHNSFIINIQSWNAGWYPAKINISSYWQ